MSEQEVTLREFLSQMCEARMKHHCALVHHAESKIDALEEMTATNLRAIYESRDMAAKVLDARLEHMNGAWTALREASAVSFTRKEHEAYQAGVEKDLRLLREWRSEIRGMAMFAMALGGISTIISVIALITEMRQ